MVANDFTIIVDTREQNPYFVDSEQWEHISVVRQALKTGDYSVKGFEDEVCVERKELTDLMSSLGTNRERFGRELERMSHFKRAAVVIEATYPQLKMYCKTGAVKKGGGIRVRTNFEKGCGMHWNSVWRSLTSMWAKFGIAHFPCTDREFAELVTFAQLEQFMKYKREGIL